MSDKRSETQVCIRWSVFSRAIPEIFWVLHTTQGCVMSLQNEFSLQASLPSRGNCTAVTWTFTTFLSHFFFFRTNPTDLFRTLKFQNLSHDIPELHKIRLFSDFQALQLWKGWLGSSYVLVRVSILSTFAFWVGGFFCNKLQNDLFMRYIEQTVVY